VSVWAVVPAAGAGRRMGAATPKQFLHLDGRPLLVHALVALSSWPRLDGMVVVVSVQDVARVQGLLEGAGVPRVLRVVPGGAERQDSVMCGLEALVEAAAEDVVFVHDGARPFPPVARFAELEAAARPDGALLALPCRDTLKAEEAGAATGTVDRRGLWQAQTPQAFPLSLLREALALARADGRSGTDEAGLVEALGKSPRFVLGDPSNLKVTDPADLEVARAIARERARLPGRSPGATALRVGHGFDVHRLVEGRKLVLGGVEIPHARGLLGHSDADVLAHAVADACLGAAGMGDIGRHFPDTDATWAGASSLGLLERVARLLRERGFSVLHVDATLVAERPRVAPHVAAMEGNLSGALGLGSGGVSVKATTTEGLGFEGREEGISAHAVALLAESA